MTSKALIRFTQGMGLRTTLILALAALLLVGFSFAESGSAAPLAWDYATVLTVGSRIGIGTETPDANTVMEARRSDTTDSMIKSRHLTKGAYFQTQSGINWAGYNMLNAAGATATYFGYRGSTQFRIYDSLAAEDRLLMDAAGTDNGNIYLNPSNTGGVGIGTTSLSARLHVETASGDAIWAETPDTAGHGVIGIVTAATGYASGVYGETLSTDGSGVTGIASASTGSNTGVYGTSRSTSGRGVVGWAQATTGDATGVYGYTYAASGYGVQGYSYSTTGNSYGVYGVSVSSSGRGVVGEATATTGTTYGVYGQSSSTNGRGLQGYADATTGTTFGVLGRSDSPQGRGVYGLANATAGITYGVWGRSNSPSGSGVYGTNSVGGVGVLGENTGYGEGIVGRTDSGTGIKGEAMATSGYFAVGIAGLTHSDVGVGITGGASATTGTNYGVRGFSDSTAGYDFYADGVGTDYGPFTGAHEVRLSDSFPAEAQAGLIVSAVGEAQIAYATDGSVDLSSTLPTVRLADTAEDKAVLGVLVAEVSLPEDHWYQAGEGERFASVNALGEGRVWVTNLNGEIEAGDYITTSDLPGYGQRQQDDLLHSYTLGKATETIDWDTVSETIVFKGLTCKVYLLAVVYTSG